MVAPWRFNGGLYVLSGYPQPSDRYGKDGWGREELGLVGVPDHGNGHCIYLRQALAQVPGHD